MSELYRLEFDEATEKEGGYPFHICSVNDVYPIKWQVIFTGTIDECTSACNKMIAQRKRQYPKRYKKLIDNGII